MSHHFYLPLEIDSAMRSWIRRHKIALRLGCFASILIGILLIIGLVWAVIWGAFYLKDHVAGKAAVWIPVPWEQKLGDVALAQIKAQTRFSNDPSVLEPFNRLSAPLLSSILTPVPVPGASSLLGAVILVMALRLAFLLPPRLPDFIGERRIRFDQYPRQIRGSIKFLRVVEKLIKPRRSSWLNWRVIYSGNAILIAFMAFLLALPVPLPFTNTLPAYTIILLAASMMEQDGVLIWLGYGVAAGALAYFGFISGSIVALLAKS